MGFFEVVEAWPLLFACLVDFGWCVCAAFLWWPAFEADALDENDEIGAAIEPDALLCDVMAEFARGSIGAEFTLTAASDRARTIAVENFIGGERASVRQPVPKWVGDVCDRG